MRLTKLSIYGFKSFAHRTEIVFPQNVTGIVGPNGSGKSNIGDAVRWVLGEQSAKMLRGNSMQDVIFNGTEQKKPMNYCEVALTFDNADHQLPVDFGEVSITRRVYRSGESEYLLNGATCRLRDVVDLFRDTGVGKEGYSIIGQGRIDEILSQRSEDRRAVFEEAAGISRYKTRKEDAEQRLKRADENLVRVIDVIDELQTHLLPLEKQAEVAKEYLALSETLKSLDVQLFLLRYDRLQKRGDAMESALLAIADSLTEASARLEEAQAAREKREASVESIQQALSESNRALLEKSDALHLAREEAQNIDSRIRSAVETLERLEGEDEALQNRMKLLLASMSQQDGGLAEAEKQRQAAQVDLEKKRARLAEVSQAAQAVEDQLSEHKQQMMESVNRAASFRANQARQQAMLSQMQSRKAELEQELLRHAEKEQALLAAQQAAARSLDEETAKLSECKRQAQALEEAQQSQRERQQELEKQRQTLARALATGEARLKTLRELQEGYEGYQYPVKNALTYARKAGLSGVEDVVAKLVSVPQRLETAMDMALGGAMQNIVTQTEQDAKTLIEYLRQNRLGRATFLPISAVRGRTLAPAERGVLSMSGCVGVASELVSFDEKYRGVVESLLGRTVVTETLDSAIAVMRAGRQAFRVVTLQGDVMHSGGSMTGGSIQQKAQNLLGREREISELTAQVDEARLKAQAAEKELQALESTRRQGQQEGQQAVYALHQQEIAVVRDTEHLKAAQSELSEHRDTAEGLRQAIAQLTESASDLQSELERLEKENTISPISQEEMDRRTDELSAQLNTARREREAAQDDMTAAMLAEQEMAHTVDRITRDKSRVLSAREDCENEQRTLRKKREETRWQLSQSRTAHDAAVEKSDRAAAAMEQAKQAVTELEARRESEQRALKDEQNEIDACQLLVSKETERQHRQEMTLGKLRADITQLTDRLWDTYELTYAGAQEAKAELDTLRRERGEELPPFVEQTADEQARKIRDRIRQMGTVNVGAIEEYAQMRERHTTLTGQRDDLEHAKKDLEDLIERLLQKMEEVFVGQFSLLQGYFATTFERLFGGGHGEIQLSDPADPLNCGIEIIVQPPGKKRQLLSLFSGGERALTAIAILFAMLMLKPTPFCILDEIEAALDEANITYFADYLKEFSKDTQFIVVTHRKGTMERCDTLFGVAMEEKGVSSMVSVNLQDYQ